MNIKRFFLSFLLCLGTIMMFAQQQTIKGVVTDNEDGLAVIGAIVKVKNSNRGTITDVDGNYSIEANPKDVLEFSFLGAKTKTVTVGSNSIIDIILEFDNVALDEVVVVGYGMVKKSDLTGSVASLKSEDLIKGQPISIEQGMQGRLAGVNVTRNDGAPGGGISMQIRGTNSFLGGTEPLYVIDGVPMKTGNSQSSVSFDTDKDVGSQNALSFLDPNDIESIEVLKDGSSIAVYGADGANGVVMITTKKGRTGGDKIEASYGLTTGVVAKKLKTLGARDYAIYRNETSANTELINTGTFDPDDWDYPFPGKYSTTDEGKYRKGPDDFNNDPYYWQDQIFQTAISQNASITISGAQKDYNYSIGGSFIDQEGVVINSKYERKSLRINFNRDVKKWLKIGTSTVLTTANSKMLKTATKNQNNGDEGVIRSALYYPPTYLIDDEVTYGEYAIVTNPVQYTTAPNKNQNYNVFTSNYLDFKLMEGLIYKMVIGYNYNATSATRYFPRYLQEGRTANGKSQVGDNLWRSYLWDNLLMYNRRFDKHDINATLGTSWESSKYSNKRMSAEGFGTDANNGAILKDGAIPGIPNTNYGGSKLMSLIFRGAYHYDSKYYLTLTGRVESSSKFAKDKRTGFFPSVGVSWRASGERFLNESTVISNLKARYSLGTSGNSGIEPYSSLALLQGGNYPVGNGVANGYVPDKTKVGNPLLKWETSVQHDLGIDISLFNKLDISVDYYHKSTKDLLQKLIQPGSTGINYILTNLGNVTNQGLELTLGANIINTKDFKWSAGFNFGANKNRVTNLGFGPDYKIFPNELWSSMRPFVITEGKPIGQLYGFKEDGIWNTREEVINSKQFQTQGKPGYKVEDNVPATEALINQKWIGEIRYHDKNDDGSISDEDQDYIGDVNPDFTYGFNMNFSYKNIDFSFLFNGVHGNDIINMPAMRFYNIGAARNTLQSIYENRWTSENYGSNPKSYNDSSRSLRFSRRFIEDGSYLKLRNITVGYSLFKPFKGVEIIRVYASGNNLLTFTDYSGYDPEVNSFGSDPSMRGVDAGGYPQAREFTFGVNLTF